MSSLRELLHQADALARAGHTEKAIATYTSAIGESPTDSQAYLGLASVYHSQGHLQKAIGVLEQAKAADVQNAVVFNNLGVLYYKCGTFRLAKEHLRRAIEVNPEYSEATYSLGKLHLRELEFDAASTLLRRCLRTDGGLSRAGQALKGVAAAKMRSGLPLRISIFAFSDVERNQQRKLRWGDYWVKHDLKKALERMGHAVVERDPDVFVHLFGAPLRAVPSATWNVLWIHSHPDWVTPGLLKSYDRVFCISPQFVKIIRSWGIDAHLLVGATSKKPVKTDIKYDLLFVGNTKGRQGRRIIRDLGDLSSFPYKLKVWGEGWKELVPSEFYGGLYYDNQELGRLYASSLISLNDHHDDMRRNGFINPRILDILASGGFCISDRHEGVRAIFGRSVPTYGCPRELRALIDRYVLQPEARRALMDRGRQIAASYSFEYLAGELLQSISAPETS